MKSATPLCLNFFFLLCIPNLDCKITATPNLLINTTVQEREDIKVAPGYHCWTATVANSQEMELFSPKYPQRYPKNTNCETIIIAPKGHIILLDFRDQFQLEEDEGCKFDFLEIRDGKYSYSNIIGKFCGHKFPEEIASSTRYLWLRFVSDISIEYAGFRAVYTFRPRGQTEGTRYLHKRQVPPDGAESEDELEDPNDPCWKFKVGDPNAMEFYSPMYPEHYPQKLDCVRTLTAPEGNIVFLDFRDQFHVEDEGECKYDYLEVRDGQYGYSEMIGKFCGNNFPDEIVSSTRYLWLRFVSDVSIEYAGFRAVYEFRPGGKNAHTLPVCVIEKSGPEGWIGKTDISNETLAQHLANDVALDCMFIVRVKEGWNLQLQFTQYKMDKPNDCESNYIEVFSNGTQYSYRVEKFCGSIAKNTSVKSNVTHIRFVAELKALNSSFAILWTAYREILKDQQCEEDEFDCDDLTCIPLELRCNGNSNCRYGGDEDTESTCVENKGMLEKLFNETHMIAIVALFFIILAGMCSTFLYNCSRKLVRDHRIIKQQMAESRASRLDQLGKPVSMTQLSTVIPAGSHSQTDDSSGASILQRAECCVSDAELRPILRSSTHTEDLLLMPEMRDSECQTRESLFQTASFTPISSAAESFTPPPPPPPPTSRPPRSTPRSTASPGFTTFGKTRQKASVEPRFRAEAVIELHKRADSHQTGERPFSVQSTKSAPDVIVTH